MYTEILTADYIIEATLLHYTHGLFVDMGEDHLNACLFALLDQTGDAVHSSCVDGGYGTHTQHQNILGAVAVVNRGDLISRAEEHGAADFVNHDICGNGLQTTVFVVGDFYVFPFLNVGNISHTLHEHQASQTQTNADSNNQVEYYGQNKAQQQNCNVALGCLLDDFNELFELVLRNSELVFIKSCSHIFMGMCIDVRVDSD